MKEILDALRAAGLNPVVIDENTNFSKLPVPGQSVNTPGFWYTTDPDSLIPKFNEVPINADFISPEGDWCRKSSDTHATMMDHSSSAYTVGELLPFSPDDRVEYLPRRP